MNLSPHFTLEELVASDKARELGNANTPTPEHLVNLHALADGMEKVRAACGGHPITVTSAYRNPVVNHAVGGVPNSAHALGTACDFTVSGMDLIEAAKLIEAAGFNFDQLIHESSRHILHIAFPAPGRMEVLTQAGPAGTAFTKGIG